MKIKKIKSNMLILIIILLILLISFMITISFSRLSNNKTVDPEKNTSKILPTKTESSEKETTTKQEENQTTTTRVKNETTLESTTTKPAENILIKKMYYYTWTEDEKRDYTGRNCLFLYDINGKIVDGYVTILYYEKYIKEQYITDNVNDCFLEDKYSSKIIKITKDNEEYYQ